MKKEELIRMIDHLASTVEDVLPQLSNITLQDYGALNEGLMLHSKYKEEINQEGGETKFFDNLS